MSSKNRDNIIEKNMEAKKAGPQGQGANVYENDHKNFNMTQQNLEENLEMENHNLLPNTDENTTENVNKGKDMNLSSEGKIEPSRELYAKKTIENNGELPTQVTAGLDNKENGGSPDLPIKTENLENSEGVLIVSGSISNMCARKVDIENGPEFISKDENSSKSGDECDKERSCKKHDKMLVNPEALQKGLNANNKTEYLIENKNSIENAAYSTNGSERDDAVRSPEMLADEVTKMNISAEEKKFRGTQSNVIINRQSESLKCLMAYHGGTDSESDTEPEAEVCDLSSEDEENNTKTKKTWRKNMDTVSGTSDSESDSTASTLSSDSDSEMDNSNGDSASVIDASDDGLRAESPVLNKTSDKGAVKKNNRNILDLEKFLPPLPDLSKLNINVDSEDFMHIGRISATISELVTVAAIPGTPAFDLDSMLFIDDQTSKKPIGPIFDVLGPVAEPIYCVRFNSEQEVKDLGIKSGMKVYAAPKSDEFTKFVFVQELMKMKGCDASWLNDNETPSDIAEFSDDEKEREARRAKKTSAKRKLNDDSLERHKRYESTMNQCNTLNTRVCRLMDAHKTMSRQIRPNRREDIKPPPGCPELPTIPPLFDPTIPPPGFGQPGLYSMSIQPPVFNTSPGFGQTANFNNPVLPQNNQSAVPGAQSPLGTPILFGHHYANEPPSPQSLYPPPARWSWQHQHEGFRRPNRSNNPRSNHQNSDNYFTNNSRNFRGAGPSSQPF